TMLQLIRTALLATLLAALSVPALSGTAHAATPSKNTAYKDASVDADLPGSIKIKIGSSTSKIAKLTLKVTCEDGTKEKLVLKDVRLTGGSFDEGSGPGQSVRGSFTSKHKVTGSFRTDLCGFFGGDYT
ncbi:hypothetical protein, partial [Bradyrhizobium sp. NBAIM08]|uniref:hypothetical protein n=1 Tax=Bradyrhizobium sp. NBAIM08 TaxID=2793815 RepID=UPI001CD6170B